MSGRRERIVEWRDGGNHPHWHAGVIADAILRARAALEGHGFPREAAPFFGRQPQDLGGARRLAPCLADSLAALGCDRRGVLVLVRLDPRGRP
jgi:hypothetical protein